MYNQETIPCFMDTHDEETPRQKKNEKIWNVVSRKPARKGARQRTNGIEPWKRLKCALPLAQCERNNGRRRSRSIEELKRTEARPSDSVSNGSGTPRLQRPATPWSRNEASNPRLRNFSHTSFRRPGEITQGTRPSYKVRRRDTRPSDGRETSCGICRSLSARQKPRKANTRMEASGRGNPPRAERYQGRNETPSKQCAQTHMMERGWKLNGRSQGRGNVRGPNANLWHRWVTASKIVWRAGSVARTGRRSKALVGMVWTEVTATVVASRRR